MSGVCFRIGDGVSAADVACVTLCASAVDVILGIAISFAVGYLLWRVAR